MSVMEGVLDRAAGPARAVVELAVLARRSRRGLASTRQAVFAGFPRSGLPPRFGSYEDYAETVGWMEATGASATTPTSGGTSGRTRGSARIELRVPDCQFDIEYALALSAYVQALVAELLDECEKASPPASPTTAPWSPRTSGSPPATALDAQMMDLAGGRRVKLPASQLARRRLRQLAPYARELGCYDALQGIERIL